MYKTTVRVKLDGKNASSTLKELIFAGTKLNFRGRKKIEKIAFCGNLFSRFSLFRIFRGKGGQPIMDIVRV